MVRRLAAPASPTIHSNSTGASNSSPRTARSTKKQHPNNNNAGLVRLVQRGSLIALAVAFVLFHTTTTTTNNSGYPPQPYHIQTTTDINSDRRRQTSAASMRAKNNNDRAYPTIEPPSIQETTTANDKEEEEVDDEHEMSSSSVGGDDPSATTTNNNNSVIRDKSAFPAKAQMGWNQVEAILSVLPEDGNLLVWGLGNDSPFWNRVTTGTVIFLEDGSWDTNLVKQGKRWFDAITEANPELQAYAIDYTTKNSDETLARYSSDDDNTNKRNDLWASELQLTLDANAFPEAVLATTHWDVILVDAPLGMPNEGPGRYQSLYMSKVLAEASIQNDKDTNNIDKAAAVHIFVDDYERPVERQFSQILYGAPPQTVIRRPAQATVPSNEQAHFVVVTASSSKQNKEEMEQESEAQPETTTSGAVKQSAAVATKKSKPKIRRDKSAFPERAQMGWNQVESILSVLPENGNLLVWGLGNDSPFWNRVTTGTVIFLEDGSWDTNLVNGKRWFDSVTAANPELQAYTIDYTTKNSPASYARFMGTADEEDETTTTTIWENELDLSADFPEAVLETRWDVILVDAPLGQKNLGPGRYQSLYMTKLLAQASREKDLVENDNKKSSSSAVVHVFVDDYERTIEREFSQKVFDRAPFEVTKRMARKNVPANEQAHFVMNDAKGDIASLITPESWIVLVEVSDGYYDFFLNWLHYYDKLNYEFEVVVVAEDDEVKEKIERDVMPTTHYLTVQRSGVVKLNSTNFVFGGAGYKQIVSARPTHILAELKKGRNVIYGDIDSVWQSDPLPHLTSVVYRKDAILQVEYDQCYWNNKLKPCYCTGFIAVVSNARTIKLMYDWQEALKENTQVNQLVFNDIIHNTTNNIVRHGPLSKVAFPNGDFYFEKFNAAQRDRTVVVHNNFIKGSGKKRDRFIKHNLWSLPAQTKEKKLFVRRG